MNVVVYSPPCTVSILHVSLSLYNLACCADGGGTSFNPLSRLIHRKSASVRPPSVCLDVAVQRSVLRVGQSSQPGQLIGRGGRGRL